MDMLKIETGESVEMKDGGMNSEDINDKEFVMVWFGPDRGKDQLDCWPLRQKNEFSWIERERGSACISTVWACPMNNWMMNFKE